MSAHLTAAPLGVSSTPRAIARLRAVAALVWAAAIVLVAGDDAGPDLAAGLAALVAAYPAIDVVASLAQAGRSRRLQINAIVSALAVVALAVAGLGSDMGAVLAVFGVWAVVSGVLQLVGARRIPMIISGGLSAIAGVSFVASSGAADPSLTPLAGYAAVGALLFLVWSYKA